MFKAGEKAQNANYTGKRTGGVYFTGFFPAEWNPGLDR